MKIKQICFIVPNYPTKVDPMYTFVRELVVAISELGIKCSVIAPQSITNYIYKRKRKRQFYWKDIVKKDVAIDVYQPIHFPFLNIKIRGYNLAGHLTSMAVKYAFNRSRMKPDVLYAHFWHSGIIAAEIAQKEDIPVFVASGESQIWVESLYHRDRIDKALKNIDGVICVSRKNLEESIDRELCTRENAIVIPNAVNKDLFYKIDKNEARIKLGFDKNDFIVAYTGAFTHRKGAKRVMDAIANKPDIKAIFIGSGEYKPKGDNVLFCGRLQHDKIVDYLNAADVFVLPTLAEGCCNAIIEAMACGLPIISSDLSFNDDILNDENSIRVDSNSVEEISKAILFLKENPDKRKKMSEASLLLAQELDISKRAEKIIKYIDSINKKARYKKLQISKRGS